MKKREFNYDLVAYRISTENGIEWVAEYSSLPSAVGGGKTLQEAIDVLNENTAIILEVYRENNEPIPKDDPTRKK